MLDVLRRNAGSWIIKVILGFIALTFIWWGVGTYSEREREVAAKVGDTVVTRSQLDEAVRGLEKTYRDVYGTAFTPEMAKVLDLRRQALDALVGRVILLGEARTLGIAATDAEVQRDIAATPAFQVEGAFSADRYRAVLAQSRIREAEYEASRREDITLRKVQGLLAGSAHVTEAEARELHDLSMRRVRLLVVASDPARVRASGAPDAGEIAAAYDRTKESYRLPARVRLLVARFDPDRFAKAAAPGEEEVRTYFEANADRFRTEETRQVTLVALPFGERTRDAAYAKAASLAALGGARGKAEFDAQARKTPGATSSTLEASRRDLPPEIADAVFGSAVDRAAGPVEAKGRFLVARVHRIRFPETLPYAEARAKAAALLAREKGKDAAVIRAYESHGKAQETKDLGAAVAPAGVPVSETGWLDGGGTGGDVPPAVVQEALLLPAGEVGPVRTVGDVHYLFKVAEKQESRLPALDEVRSRVADAVAADSRKALARAAAEKALAGAATAADLERNGKAAGLSAAPTPLFAPLSDPLPGALGAAGPEVRKEILAATAARPVVPRVIAAGPLFLAVAFLEERLPGDKEWASRREAFTASLAERKRARLLEAFVAERRREAKVEVNESALK